MVFNAFHPGVFLQELLDGQNISPHELAKSTGIHEGIIIDITMQLQGIDKETAIGFATYFGNSAEYWINLRNLSIRQINDEAMFYRMYWQLGNDDFP